MQISPYQMHNEHSVNVGDKKFCGQKRDCMCDKLTPTIVMPQCQDGTALPNSTK